MPTWLQNIFDVSSAFMPHGHCYLWLPGLLGLHVASDALIGLAYLSISLLLYILVRRIRLPFSPVFIAFGLFIALCGLTHFMAIWTVWQPDYVASGLLKAATAAASVATAVGVVFIRRQVEEVVHAARLSEERREALQQKNAELEVLYKKVSDLNRRQTDFFANVSHELRTPLALILGPVEQLLADAQLPEHERGQIESIRHNGQTLLQQVEDLLEIAKLDLGRRKPVYRSLDLVGLFDRFAAQVRSAAEGRNIRLDFHAEPGLTASTDAFMLERISLNLLTNAYKFTPEGGRIALTLAATTDGFAFAVEDSGPGIEPAERNLIFERFAQGADTERGRMSGTGLGLAIAKDYVGMLGGTIELDNGPDGGARFRVTLPRDLPADAVLSRSAPPPATTTPILTPAAAAAPSGQRRPAPADAPNILVVEDTPQLNAFICDVLSERYRVASANGGREGLAKAKSLRPDLVITDLMMPDMNGAELLAELRQRREFDAIPILLLTARADDALRVQLLESGAQDYLSKPFLPRELLARVANLLNTKSAGDTLRSALSEVSVDVAQLAQQLAEQHRELQLALETTEIARAQALQASRAKSNFLGLISHEVRTPLSIIQLCGELLSQSEPGPAEAAARERLVRATKQLSTLMSDVLSYVRIDGGHLQPQWQPLDLAELAAEAVTANQVLVSNRSVKLEYSPPPAPLPPVESDPRLVRIIINNLLTNAIKFTERGRITVTLSADHQNLRCAVEDTGIGISEQDLERIFEPFEQLEPVRRKSIPGVGLGLTLTREVARALQGEVVVTSQLQRGSTFTLQLPLKPNVAPLENGPEAPLPE